MTTLTESIAEDATLCWFGELGHAVVHCEDIAAGEPAVERYSFGNMVLLGRLIEAIRKFNSVIPYFTHAALCGKLLPKLLSRKLRVATFEKEVSV
jgi:type I restriction enzyme R subunit